MTVQETRPPVAPGELAPDFTLPALDGPATVSLSDYRGRAPVFLALLIGLWCPFCRRQIAQMAASEGRLKTLGVESIAVVATEPENARVYFKYRPTRLRLAADPALDTHRAYGLPRPILTPEIERAIETVRVNPGNALPAPLPIPEAAKALTQMDRYQDSEVDRAEMSAQYGQLKGLFLIDREGIVRWAHIECAQEGLSGFGRIPSEEEVIAAVRALPG